MYIYLLAFILGMLFLGFISFAHPRIMTLLPKLFDKVLPEIGSLVLSYVMALILYGILFLLPTYFKNFILGMDTDLDWREFCKFYFLGMLFALCGFQLLHYLSTTRNP